MESFDRNTIISQRCSGQYRAALASLSKVSRGSPDAAWAFAERIQCYFLLNDFANIFVLMAESQSVVVSMSTEHALIRLIYGFSRAHTEGALRESVLLAEDVYHTWLMDKDVQGMDEVDISLLCFYHLIEDLGSRLLSSDEEPNQELPSSRRLEALRERLLRERNINALAMIHVAEEKSTPPRERISKLQGTLAILPYEAKEMRVHLGILLAKAFQEHGDFQNAMESLKELQREPLDISNPESQLWVEYFALQLGNATPEEALEATKKLLASFQSQEDYHGALLCSISLCRLEISCSDIDSYRRHIRELLEQSHWLHLPAYETIPQEYPVCSLHKKIWYSGLEFWLQYILHLLKEDMTSRNRIGVAILCCNRFFETQSDCTIPVLKYTLSDTLAECYEDLGDLHHSLHWRLRGRTIAREANDQSLEEEAEYKLRLALSEDAVKVAVDPYGVEESAWKKAQRRDLEAGWEQARDKGLGAYQHSYALSLLRRELDDELRRRVSPSGGVWLTRVQEALEALPLSERRRKSIHHKYSLAHAAFEAGEYQKAIHDLATVMIEAKEVGNVEMESMARFTQARAYFHQFLEVGTLENWQNSFNAIGTCQRESEDRKATDVVACCHVIQAALWNARKPRETHNLLMVLNHVSRAAALWDEERSSLGICKTLGIENILSKYSLRYRNESSQYAILELAINISYEMGNFREAWKWVEYAKARAFADSLPTDSEQQHFPSIADIEGLLALPEIEESVIFVHWTFVGEQVYLLVHRSRTDTDPQMHKLDIRVPEIESWHQDVVATKEDFSEAESAEEVLTTLSELCRPLISEISGSSDETMIFCPTGILFKIPLHAIPVNGRTVLDMCPVVYAHSISVLGACFRNGLEVERLRDWSATFIGNPTEDTPAGETSVQQLSANLGGAVYIGNRATKSQFKTACSTARLVHFHGHVLTAEHQLNGAMLFHGGEELRVREVFDFQIRQAIPLIVLIGCGSGTERIYDKDEPLGFISAFLYAGASAVLGTLWPISDRLSGAAFSEEFYSSFTRATVATKPPPVLDLARRLRAAALKIKAQPETSAPYFWAGFVLHGCWKFTVS